MTVAFAKPVSKAEARKLDRVLAPFREGGVYLTNHFGELLAQYENEWVAICGDTVVAHSRTRVGLKQKLRRAPQPSPSVYTAYLTRERRTLIL